MADIVDSVTRSKIMSHVRSKNTRIEMEVRKRLWSRGIRYRLHVIGLPGKPDLVLPKRRAMIFIHGCFWHGHDCPLFRLPKTRTEFWTDKIFGNRRHDRRIREQLASMSWRTMTIWECALRGKTNVEIDRVIDSLIDWLVSSNGSSEIIGNSGLCGA